jgi:hypothetical protein
MNNIPAAGGTSTAREMARALPDGVRGCSEEVDNLVISTDFPFSDKKHMSAFVKYIPQARKVEDHFSQLLYGDAADTDGYDKEHCVSQIYLHEALGTKVPHRLAEAGETVMTVVLRAPRGDTKKLTTLLQYGDEFVKFELRRGDAWVLSNVGEMQKYMHFAENVPVYAQGNCKGAACDCAVVHRTLFGKREESD